MDQRFYPLGRTTSMTHNAGTQVTHTVAKFTWTTQPFTVLQSTMTLATCTVSKLVTMDLQSPLSLQTTQSSQMLRRLSLKTVTPSVQATLTFGKLMNSLLRIPQLLTSRATLHSTTPSRTQTCV